MKDANELAQLGRLSADPSAGTLELLGGGESYEPDERVMRLLDSDRRWRGGERGKPYAVPLNIERVLMRDPRQRGRFRYNEFDRSVEIDGRRIEDADEVAIQIWLYSVYELNVTDSAVSKVIQLIARKHTYHPVRDYLNGLVWTDKKPRIHAVLREYFKIKCEPGGVYDKISAAWLVGCVARIFDPGCKLDTCLVLVGGQGRLKSTGLAALMPKSNWFSDSSINMDSKDAFMQIHSGVWLYEFSELSDVSKKDAGRVKAFISSQKDRFRSPYSRNVVEWKRGVVFCGTTNKQAGFLSDKTGSRRFWPCLVSDFVDLEGIKANRDQIWAEAVAAYKSGARWYLTADEQKELDKISEKFQESDSWEEAIEGWLENRTAGEKWSGARIFDEVLEIPLERRHRGQEMRLSGILNALGCVRVGRGKDHTGRRVMLWQAP